MGFRGAHPACFRGALLLEMRASIGAGCEEALAVGLDRRDGRVDGEVGCSRGLASDQQTFVVELEDGARVLQQRIGPDDYFVTARRPHTLPTPALVAAVVARQARADQ